MHDDQPREGTRRTPRGTTAHRRALISGLLVVVVGSAAFALPAPSRAWAQALIAPGAFTGPVARASAASLPPVVPPAPSASSGAVILGGAAGCAGPASVCLRASAGFPLVTRGRAAPLVVDPSDDPGVVRVVRAAHEDLGRLAGQAGEALESRALPAGVGRFVVVVGTLGKSALVDELAARGKLGLTGVAGVWEGYLVEVVERPWAGVSRALVIAGADPHGTIFGLYDLVAAAGLSPWTRWLDLPVTRRAEVSVTPGRRLDHPAVRFRGLSLNEESPALAAWVKERFGGFGPAFHEQVFDLVLRLKGNVVWRRASAKPDGHADPETPVEAALLPESHAGTRLVRDDGWGNLRALPPWGRERPGGTGLYYHLDHGDEPRSDEWLDDNQLARVWEQLTLAHEHGVARIWVADVGRLATHELALSFFLEDAWQPTRMSLARMEAYPVNWAAAQLGEAHAREIGALLARYAELAARRRPELLTADVYSVVHERELERVLAEHRALVKDATALEKALPPSYADAYFRLVLFPIAALANLHELHGAVALNRWYASQQRAATDRLAAEGEAAHARDAALTEAYHRRAGGAWNHLMEVPHLDERGAWPGDSASPYEAMPDLVRTPADLALAVEGDARAYDGRVPAAVLPALSTAAPELTRWLEVFSRDARPAVVELELPADLPWLTWRKLPGPADQTRVELRLAARALAEIPPGVHRVPVIVHAGAREMTVEALVENPGVPAAGAFVEVGGAVAFEAAHASRVIEGRGRSWVTIPGLGKTGLAIAPFPRTVSAAAPGDAEAPHLEYDVFLGEAGPFALEITVAPTRDVLGQGGLRYAVSVDEQPPQMVNVHAHESEASWRRWVADKAIVRSTTHLLSRAGAHVVKLWAVDPGLVFTRVALFRPGAARGTYLGPRESPRR